MTLSECNRDIKLLIEKFDNESHNVEIFIESAYKDREVTINELNLYAMKESAVDTDEYINKLREVNKLFIEKSIAARKYTAKNLSNFTSEITMKVSKLLNSNDYKKNIGKIRELIAKNPEVSSRYVSVPEYSESKKLMDEAISKLEKYIAKVKKEAIIRPDELKLIMGDCKRASSGAKKHMGRRDITIGQLVKFFTTDMSLDKMTQYAKKKEPIYRNLLRDVGPEQVNKINAAVNKGLTKIVNVYGKMIQTRAYLEWYEAIEMYKALKTAKTFADKKPKEPKQPKQPKAPKDKTNSKLPKFGRNKNQKQPPKNAPKQPGAKPKGKVAAVPIDGVGKV